MGAEAAGPSAFIPHAITRTCAFGFVVPPWLAALALLSCQPIVREQILALGGGIRASEDGGGDDKEKSLESYNLHDLNATKMSFDDNL